MNLITYFLIFSAKSIENTLATLRIILVANGKKGLGAILQGIISIIWVLSAGIVIININEAFLKIVFFALGSLVGSYIGSIIEEKLALGISMITAIIDLDTSFTTTRILRKKGYIVNIINSDYKKRTITIMAHRKRIQNIIKIIKTLDNNAIIMVQNIKSTNL